MAASGTAETTMAKNRWMLEDLAAPLAKRPIAQIVPIEVLDVLKRIEKSGRRETARKLRGTIGSCVPLRRRKRCERRTIRLLPFAAHF